MILTLSQDDGGWRRPPTETKKQLPLYAQQFEWANKHPICHGIKRRIDRLYEVLNMDKWTSKSEKSSLTPLQIKWFVEHHERSVPPHISDDL